MSNERTKVLCALHISFKEQEQKAQENRRAIEDELLNLLEIRDDFEGTSTIEAGDFKVKVTGRMNYKIDQDSLQQIAVDNGLESSLELLFRWKPEINMKAWKGSHDSITRPLSAAITATAGRPSFSITSNEEQK